MKNQIKHKIKWEILDGKLATRRSVLLIPIADEK